MDIIKLDKYELERYFAEHNLEDAAVGDGASLGKALEKFEAAFNLDTSLPDVKKLEDRLQGSVPPASREYFYLKLLSYVVDITNRNLPVDAAESQALLESLVETAIEKRLEEIKKEFGCLIVTDVPVAGASMVFSPSKLTAASGSLAQADRAIATTAA